jgi:hypothetical protein
MTSAADKIQARIRTKGEGWAFTAKDFLDIANRASVDKALSMAHKSGEIRRVCRGVYDYPRQGTYLPGPMPPDFDQVAHALARSTGTRIIASGATAANLLGISEQVPAKVVYLTDGTSRKTQIGNRSITFKHVRSKELLADELSGIVVQALRFTGRNALTDKDLRRIQRKLTKEQRKTLIEQAQYTSDWIADAARKIAEEL